MTVSAQVADALRQQILNGQLPAGSQLRQDALAAQFSISRIPVREALLLLEAAGLVRIEPHRGATVSGLSREEIEDIFQLRASLEPELLRLSVPGLSPQDFADLRRLRDEYSQALKAQRVEQWGELNRQFHLALLRHCGRPKSFAIVSGLLADSDRPTRLQLSLSGDLARANIEHTAILALCEEGKIDDAADLLRAHIDYACRSLVDSYLSSLEKPEAIPAVLSV